MTIDTERLLRRSEVLDRAGLSKSGLYKLVAQGRFPAPVRIGPRAVRWRQSDVDRWLAGLPPTREPESA